MDRSILIIAGPNGAGKTTFATEYLPREANCQRFVNADLIAAGLSPFDVTLAEIRAARVMIEYINSLVKDRTSFGFETTLSGRSYARSIPKWRASGYFVKLVFLKLESVETAVARVASRVAKGGHFIPEDVIRRRFGKGYWNFEKVYKPIVDSWVLYDNDGPVPVKLSEGSNNE